MSNIDIIYCRQSVLKEDSLSINTQIEKSLPYVDKNNYEIYKDEGISGSTIDRESFQKVLELINQDKVDKLVVYRLDRLVRSISHFSNLVNIFAKHNVTFISATENIDLSSSSGKLMANLLSVFAEFERDSIRQRITDAYHKRVQLGAFGGGKLILGFDNDKTVINDKSTPILVPNDDIKIVIDMFNYYISGNISLRNTAIYINKNYNKKYDSSMISKYLRNPIYVKSNPDIYNFYKSKGYIIYNDIEDYNGNGLYIIGKQNPDKSYNPVNKQTVLVALHDGIIDPNIFLKVQYKLSNNKQIKRNGKSKYTWISNIYCKLCGNKMAIQTNRMNISYLNCRTKMRNQGCKGLNTIRVSNIEPILAEYIQKKLNTLKNEKIHRESKYLKVVDDYKIRLSKIDDEIEIYKSKILLANDIVMNIINDKILELTNERNKIIDEINKVKIEEDISLEELIIDKPFNTLSFDKKKDIFQLLVNRIYISESEINIIWNI